MSGHITVVGSINRDLTLRVTHLPVPGETVTGGDITELLGGKGANQALTAAALGGKVRFICAVGTDGNDLLTMLADGGVDVSGVVHLSETPTGTALILVSEDEHGENVIALSPGANGWLLPQDVVQRVNVGPSDVVLLQQEIPSDTVLAAAHHAHAAGACVILNPAPARTLPDELLECVDFLIPNQGEIAQLLGEECPRSMEEIERLMERVPHRIGLIVTLGAEGSLVRDGDKIVRVPAGNVRVIDTVGAGDSYCAAVAVALANGSSVVDAAAWASAVGDLAVQHVGAQGALADPKQLAELIRLKPAPNTRTRPE